MATVRLTNLLPTNGYLLPYALSLFFPSLVLTFAGAFLTLDRTRSFAPTDDAFQGRQKSISRLIAPFFRGGVGGILTGFVFCIHLTTFLSLLIPSVTSSQPLKPASYLSVWLLSSLVVSIAAGRWKYFAFVASGFCGGACFALAVSVIIHPSLLTRIVLVTVLASVLTVLVPLPTRGLRSVLLRISSSAAGSFGLVLSIALFSHMEPWSNVWERLWVHNDIKWGSAQEKGLSAAFFLLLTSGVGTDWWLKSTFGENPDQKWDNYLAQYVANLPAESNRAGVFHPFASIRSKYPFKYPGIDPITPSELSQEKNTNYIRQGKKGKWMGGGRTLKTTRETIKFRPLDDNPLTSSEAGDVSTEDSRHVGRRSWLAGVCPAASTYSSTSTILDDAAYSRVASEKDPYQGTNLSTSLEMVHLPGYLDNEADITSNADSVGRSPGSNLVPPSQQENTQFHKPQADDPRFILPSDVSASSTRRRDPQEENSRGSSKGCKSPRWQAFWRDVNEKIQHQEMSKG